METERLGADGRRLFTAAFKREQIGRVLSGERTLAELSRELQVSPSVVRRWKQLMEVGAHTAVAADGAVVPAAQLREAQQRIKELERALACSAAEQTGAATSTSVKLPPQTTWARAAAA